MFRQDRTNPSTAVSNWRGRHDTPKAWPSTAVSTWLNGGLFGVVGDAWVALNTNLLTSDTTTVTMTSAAATEPWSNFKDLMLISYGRDKYTGTIGNLLCKVNIGTVGNYRTAAFLGDGASATSNRYTDSGIRIAIVPRDSADAGEYGTGITIFSDINDTAKYTTGLTIAGCDQDGAGQVGQLTSVWESTAVVTTMSIIASSEASDVADESRFDLFGLRAG